MDKTWISFLMALAIALVRMCDCQRDSSAGSSEGTGARVVWDQLRTQAKSAHRSARQLGSHQSPQYRPRVSTRQSRPGSTQKARLVGPNVCGGQQCCSGWAVAPGTNRCIKPDCQPPCLNRGSCSRPQTCVCRSGYQGPRCEEVAPEQVYIRSGGALKRLEPGSSSPFTRSQQSRRRPAERQASHGPDPGASRPQTPRPATTRPPLHTVTQVRRGPPDSSPHQTGTSRTVKRYPSSTGPITSNALPNGNGHGGARPPQNAPRPHADARLQGAGGNAVLPAGANLTSNLDRIKIVFTPMVCRRVCSGGRCHNNCEKGDTTTIYSENQQPQQPAKTQGYRVFFCQIPCRSGGRCVGRDECWCPSNSTGKFCHLPVPPPARPTQLLLRRADGQPARNASAHSQYTLPLSNQQVSMHPSLVNVHIQHPPGAEVQVHQVARVRPGQRPPSSEGGAHSVQQRSQPGNNGHFNGNGHGNGHHDDYSNGHGVANGNGPAGPQQRQNGHVGRCFQETVDGQCGKPLPGLTKQEDCCGSVGASWGLNKCTECPSKPAYAVIANGQVECPKGYKRMNMTHCQDINECLMPGICKNAECLNTRGSYRCICKPGYMLDPARSHCVSDKALSDQRGMCYRSTSAGSCSLPLPQHITKQICCCSRVGKAWGRVCERCPLPGSDHFKEICPAGHGYTYSRSDVQISLRQLEDSEVRRTENQPSPDSPHHPRPPPPPALPDYTLQELPQEPQITVDPLTPWFPHLTPQQAHRPHTPPTAHSTHSPQQPWHPQTPQQPQDTPAPPRPPHVDRETSKGTGDLDILRPPVVVTDSPLTDYPDVLDKATPPPINWRPDSEDQDTAFVDSATKVTDIDECANTPTICGHGQCVVAQTGHTCLCDPGYMLSALQTNCIDVNECEDDPCGGKGRCINTYGSYTCHCHSGFSQVITQNRKFCQDVNECDMPNKCPDGECINTEGSYTCECSKGYAKGWRGQCEDVDECRSPSSCPSGVCVNTPGSFHCQDCEPGFRPTNGRCVDVNECLNQSVCSKGRCVNTHGSYNCNCYHGYQLSLDSNDCQDVNECLLPGACLHGRCSNLDGSHRCSCDHGYQATSDEKACEDVNECATHNVCPTGTCTNTEGSYECQNCRPGFGPSADLLSCEDVDECQSASACGNGICLNSEGSYSCVPCPTGYTVSQDGELCLDIDECALPGTCPLGTCTNTEGSYSCITCTPGFRVAEDGQNCEDVDECVSRSACPGQLCVNTPGSFACRSCAPGLRPSDEGSGCEDIDECQSPEVCPMGICTNTEGSFSCMACDPGFSLTANGLSCQDVNECEVGGVCEGGECTNSPGSYSCSCPPGLELVDGKSCRDVDECLAEGICGEGECLNTGGSYVCVCSDGYTSITGGTGCQDVDECSKDSVCPHGQCLNTDGAYLCLCEAGFKFNPDTADCEDQDECKEFGSSICGTWRCENTIGSYRCIMGCQPGMGSQDKGDCGEGNQTHPMLLVIGLGARSVVAAMEAPLPAHPPLLCNCLDNETLCPVAVWRLTQGNMCVTADSEVDKCANETLCESLGFCENVDGGYRCHCYQGYTNPPDDATQCVDVNECEMSEARCGQALCENADGSFLCICPSDQEEFDPRTSQCRSLGKTNAHRGIMGVLTPSPLSRAAWPGGWPPPRPVVGDAYEGSAQPRYHAEDGETVGWKRRIDATPKPLTPGAPPSTKEGEGEEEEEEEAVERKECYYNLNDANFCDNVLSRNTTKQECCCTVGAGWGDDCEIHACPSPGRDDYNRLCPHGSGLLPGPPASAHNLDKQSFIDVDECAMFAPDICRNGRCANLFSSFTCYCRSGYYYDNVRLQCVDYDECETEDSCVDGVCVNTAGSFNCFCSPPLVLDSTRQRCVGLNTSEESLGPEEEDIHLDICWQTLVEESVCSRPLLGHRTTYTECCCLHGVAWSQHCAFCPMRDSDDYAAMCNLPRGAGGSDSLRERPGYEYGPDGPFLPSDWDNYGGPLPGGAYYLPEAPQSVPLFTDAANGNYYGPREPALPPARVPVHRPRESQPRPLRPYSDRSEGFEGLRAEECGILNGCENGRCVRVREGYTCDCFDGYELDLTKMACVDVNECKDISDAVGLCQNGLCANTEGSYKCTCLPGFQASARPNQCIPEIPVLVGTRETGN
ncbi:latent-transforming growth factor beta-binding protein 2-like [Aplochiton taeniatus]